MTRGNPDKVKPYEFGDSSAHGTAQKQREIQRAGGLASVAARRKKKALLESARVILSADLPSEYKGNIERRYGELPDEADTTFAYMTARMVDQAMNGDVRAFNALKDIVTQLEETQAPDEIEDDPLTASLEALGKEL